MELFYLFLITLVLHFSAVVFSFFALIRRWGYYWVFPFFASLLFFVSLLFETFKISSEVALVTGADLLLELLNPMGALCWLIGLVILHYKFVTRKSERFNKSMMLEDYPPDDFSYHTRNDIRREYDNE